MFALFKKFPKHLSETKPSIQGRIKK